jgi:hypothetical protein
MPILAKSLLTMRYVAVAMAASVFTTAALSQPATGNPPGLEVKPQGTIPFQRSAPLQIAISAKAWSWSVFVPSRRQLTIQYVSASFSKYIPTQSDIEAPGIILTITTVANGVAVPHVVPVRGIQNFYKSQFVVAQPLTLYADANSTVVITVENLYSPGYQYEGFVSISGELGPLI